MLLGIDQYGYKYWIEGKHPRKELLEKVAPYSKPRVHKMYETDSEGNNNHIGYVIGEFWVKVFQPVTLGN